MRRAVSEPRDTLDVTVGESSGVQPTHNLTSLRDSQLDVAVTSADTIDGHRVHVVLAALDLGHGPIGEVAAVVRVIEVFLVPPHRRWPALRRGGVPSASGGDAVPLVALRRCDESKLGV